MKKKNVLMWLFFLLFGIATMNAQQYTLTGSVFDEVGDPIIGATIMVEGTSRGTATDLDGNFTINVSEGETLKISYVGYIGQTINIKGQNNLQISLQPDSSMLDDVVVVGYGTIQRKNFTGSVSTVKVADSPLSVIPSTSAVDALRGTVTGINMSQQTTAGGTPSIVVRGQKSVNGGSDPLIVVDGVIFQGSLADLDPGMIESMSVLKDATSLAAYGSQAANGVLMITTKKGIQGKPIVSFKGSWAWSNPASKPDLLSPQDYVRKNNLLILGDENVDPTWMSTFEYDNYKAGRTIDWYDYSTRTGFMQTYNLAVSGATERVNYYVSGAYTTQEGVVKGDDYKRFVMNARVTSDITDWLQLGAQVNYSNNDYSGVAADLYQTTRLTPYGQATRVNGAVNKYPANEGGYRLNPLWSVLSNTIDDKDINYTTNLKGHLILKCPWVKGLQFRMNGSWMLEQIERNRFTHEGYYVREMAGVHIEDAESYFTDAATSGYLASANGYENHTKNIAWVWDNILSYTAQFGANFLDLTAVYTRDSYEFNYSGMTGSDYTALGNTNLGYYGLNYAATQKIYNPGYTRHTDVGYLFRANYNYDSRYHLNVSVRRDGSSVFGSEKKWGTFPAVGVAWTVSNEKFMESINPIINNLKIKASWGKNGNQSLAPYQTLSTITLGQGGGYAYPFGNTSSVSWGQRITAMGNNNLGWETTTSWNFGFELNMFNDRLNVNFDSYTSKTTDQIFWRTIPVMINGLTGMWDTMGRVDNWGIEATVNGTIIQSNDWTWTSTLNFYMNRNKLKDLYGDGKDDITNGLFLGKSLGAIYGYKNIGIVQENDTEYIQANGAQPGDVMFADLNGDGKITADDRTILGYHKENFRMGFGNTVTWKGFTLYAMFTGAFGGHDYGKAVNLYAYRTLSDVSRDNNLNHGWWTAENRSNIYPRINYTDGRYTPTQDYTFVRLSDLSLSYSFTQKWVRDAHLSNLNIFFAAKNLFTISKWKGGDPEVQQTIGTGYSYGYPLARTFSFGVNLSF